MIFHIAVCSPDPVLPAGCSATAWNIMPVNMPASWSSWKHSGPAAAGESRLPDTSSTSSSCPPPTRAAACRRRQSCRRGVRAPLAFLAHTTVPYAYEAFRWTRCRPPAYPVPSGTADSPAGPGHRAGIRPGHTGLRLWACGPCPFSGHIWNAPTMWCTTTCQRRGRGPSSPCGCLFQVAKPLLADARFLQPTAPMWSTLPPPLSSPPGAWMQRCPCPSPGREPAVRAAFRAFLEG